MEPTQLGRASGRTDLASEQAFAQYWRVLTGPVLVVLAFIIWADRASARFSVWHELAVLGALFVVLAVLALHRGLVSRAQLVVVNMLAGAVMGLGLAVNRLLEQHEFYLVFNLIAEPARVSLFGGLLAWALGLLLRLTRFRFTFPSIRLTRSRHA